MNRHPIDSTALIFGLLFGLAGMAILIDETVPDVDATLVTGAVVGALGIAFVATLVTRQVRVTTAGADIPVTAPDPAVHAEASTSGSAEAAETVADETPGGEATTDETLTDR